MLEEKCEWGTSVRKGHLETRQDLGELQLIWWFNRNCVSVDKMAVVVIVQTLGVS